MARKKKHAAFHREVGELVFWFAAAENTIYMVALELLGGRKIAKAVLPNFHLDRAVELVRNLARSLHPQSSHLAELEKGLGEVRACAQQRNELFHSLSLPTKLPADGREILSITSARTFKHVERERTHVGDLQVQVRAAAARVLGAALEMGLFARRTKKKVAG